MNWLKLSIEERQDILQRAYKKVKFPLCIIEKDWWVVQTLRLINKMSIAEHIVFKGGTSLSKADKKEWLDKLVANLETKKLEDADLPFRIIRIKSTGFVVKVSGLYAYVLFDFMPWKYSNISYWTAISPTLIGKIFFGKVHSISREQFLSIIINGKIPQFKKTELEIGENYKGIILEKTDNGLFIDVGYDFDWRCGSFVGYMNKYQFSSGQLFSSCSVGDEIEILYQGHNEKGRLIYSQTNEFSEWNWGIPQGLVGQIVLVTIVRREDDQAPKMLVNGIYHGKMIYSYGSKQMTKKILNNLKNGTVIHCEVIDCNEKSHVLKLKWVMELDGECIETASINLMNMRNNSIVNRIDEGAVEKLIDIREENGAGE